MRFTSNSERVRNREDLYHLIAQPIRKRESDGLLKELHNAHVPAGKIKKLDEVLSGSEAIELTKEETIEGKKTKRITSVAFEVRH